MGQQKRPDMFDVAAGECELMDFLLTRFDAMDLKSRISLEPGSRFFEQMVTAPSISAAGAVAVTVGEPAPPVSVIEVPVVPEPATPLPPTYETRNASVASGPDGADAFVRSAEGGGIAGGDAATLSASAPAAGEETRPPDLMTLIQSFHEAAERYKTEKSLEDSHEEA